MSAAELDLLLGSLSTSREGRLSNEDRLFMSIPPSPASSAKKPSSGDQGLALKREEKKGEYRLNSAWITLGPLSKNTTKKTTKKRRTIKTFRIKPRLEDMRWKYLNKCSFPRADFIKGKLVNS